MERRVRAVDGENPILSQSRWSYVLVLSLTAAFLAVVSPRLSAEITLVSRLSDARAFAAIGVGSDSPPPQIQTDFLPATLSNSATVSAESGAAGANCTSNSSIVADNQMGTLQITGNGDSSASAILMGSYGSASAKLIVTSFTLTDRSYSYSLTGQLLAEQYKGFAVSTGTAKLTAGGVTIFEAAAAHPPAVFLSQTGVLEPGDYTLSVEINAAGYGTSSPHAGISRGSANFNFSVEPVRCTDDTWTATSTTNAPAARLRHKAIWTGSEMIVWGGQDLSAGGTTVNTGGIYNPGTDTWTATSTSNAPAGRFDHALVWTGTEMIVWGGFGSTHFNTGGKYNPSTDSWTATSTDNAPTPRINPSAIWTGNELVIWGGFNVNTGGRYNPSTDTWTATSTTDAPIGRNGQTTIWTGTEMIIWGGNHYDGSNFHDLNTGGRYNPSTNTWTATSTIGAPSPRSGATGIWTGSEMIVWGGTNANGTGGRYDPLTDTWTATGTNNAPATGDSAIWTGSEMIVWGGYDGVNYSNTGGKYNPGGDSWIPTSTTNAPNGRSGHTAIWTGSEMIVWGGYEGNGFGSISGGRYCAPPKAPSGPTLGNISTRLRVEAGDNALIGGFIVTGSQSKKVIVRAIGPSLGVIGALTDPILELRDSGGAVIALNDSWRSNQETEIMATGIPPSNDLESAIVETLPANGSAYTAIVRGANNGTGVGLVEVYDLDQSVDSKLANISTRGLVQTGDNVMIAGTIIMGQTSQRVLVRAIGPSLSLEGKLADPTLELRDANGALIRANDNWRSDQEAEIIATTIPPANDLESAILESLPAHSAAYTAIVRGSNGATGVALVEIYGLPD